jgi:magnesium-protoporphyrin IX monomethyl ester (oxidative) cyclase
MRDEGARIRIVDSRPVAVERGCELRDLAAAVYRVCDRARGEETLARELSPVLGRVPGASELERVTGELVERRLCLRRSGRLLSLAVREPCRPYSAVSPFGSVCLVAQPVVEARAS